MTNLNTTAVVIKNEHLATNYYLLTLAYEGETPSPGQFVNLAVTPFLLRRPFAVFDHEKNTLTLLYKTVGEGTQAMSDWPAGEKTEILSPLGKGFPQKSNTPVLIGGGTGIASLYYLAKKSKVEPLILLGANNLEEAAAFEKLFRKLKAKLHISTLDGSSGFAGNVIEMAQEKLASLSDYTLYACGPHGMLGALATLVLEKKINPSETFVSLEARMGCGFGVCLGCAVEKKNAEGFYYVCKDGPVFNLHELNW